MIARKRLKMGPPFPLLITDDQQSEPEARTSPAGEENITDSAV